MPLGIFLPPASEFISIVPGVSVWEGVFTGTWWFLVDWKLHTSLESVVQEHMANLFIWFSSQVRR